MSLSLSTRAATLEELADLVVTVANPSQKTAVILSQDNKQEGFWPVSQAIKQSRAFCVETRPEVFALDIDTANGVQAAKQIERALREKGVLCVIVESGRPGHAHLWAKIENRELMAEAEAIAAAHGHTRRIARMRPPGSVHRSGKQPELVNCQSWAEAAVILSGKLSKSALSALESGWPNGNDGERKGRHQGLYWLACEFQRNGATRETYVQSVLRSPKASERYEKERFPDRELRKTWIKAFKEFGAHGHATKEEFDEIRRAVRNVKFQYRSHADFYFAMLNHAQRAQKLELHISVRSAALIAGVSPATASRIFKAITAKGLIAKGTKRTLATASDANIYRFLVPKTAHGETLVPKERGASFAVFHFVQLPENLRDMTAGHALARDVLKAVTTYGPLSRKEIAEKVNARPYSVGRALNLLMLLEALRMTADGLFEAVSKDKLPSYKGMKFDGRTERYRNYFQIQRENWLRHITSKRMQDAKPSKRWPDKKTGT